MKLAPGSDWNTAAAPDCYPVMRPGEPRAQHQRHALSDRESSNRAPSSLRVSVAVHRLVAEPEAAAGEIGLAVGRRVEALRLRAA